MLTNISSPSRETAGAPLAVARDGGRAADVRDAALTLFAQRGYHGTTMKDLAEAVGVRAPSLYNHIRSKQDLLRDVMRDTSREVIAEFEIAVDGVTGVEERLRSATRAYVLRHTRFRREAEIVNRELAALEEPVRSEVRELRTMHEHRIRALIEEGRVSAGFSVHSSALASFAILEMAVSVARWFREDGPISAEQVADEYAAFAMRIVGAPADRA
jgi:AcrR family transcriptional regulator